MKSDHQYSRMMILACLFGMCCLAVSPVSLSKELATVKPARVGISPERLQRVDQIARQYVDQGRVAGVVTLMSRHGKIVQSSIHGTMGIDNPLPIQADSLFRILSMTKAVTAVAALILYEEGHFHLNDPVSKFLPEFKEMTIFAEGEFMPAKSQITMHQLFTHMSGLSYGYPAGHPALAGLADVNINQSQSLQELVTNVARLPLLYEPGTEWRYSFAADILGAVVAKISGQSLGDFLNDRIFIPLHMPDTAFSVPAEKLNRLTSAHRWDKKQEAMVVTSGPPFQPGYRLLPFDAGGAGLISTAMDYLRFLEMLRAGGELDRQRILGAKTIKYMMKDHLPRVITDANIGPDHDPTLGLGAGHGLGIGVYIDPIRRGVLSSAGEVDWGGASGTVYWLDPVEDIVVVGMIQLFSSPWRFRDDLSVGIYQSLTTTLE